MNSKEGFVIGVDVGTQSTRAGIFNLKGSMLAYASKAIDEKSFRIRWVLGSSILNLENTQRTLAGAGREFGTFGFETPNSQLPAYRQAGEL